MRLRTLRSIVTVLVLLCVLNGDGFILPNMPQFPDTTLENNPSATVWASMRQHFQLQDQVYKPEVQAQIRWLQRHPQDLNQALVKATPYIYYVYQQTISRGLPAELALLPFIESQYNPKANSDAGAVGLWQMMPSTASGFGLKMDWWYDGRRDVVSSTRAALDYLTYLHDFFGDQWWLALAAYDSGEGTVLDAVHHNIRRDDSTDFWALPLPAETRNYLPKLLALAAIIKDPTRYGVTLPPVADRPYFSAVDVGSQITIDEAAKLANVSPAALTSLNAGFRQGATDPNGPYVLLIPVSKTATFEKNLAELPQWQRIVWRHYRTRSGDTLPAIATRYQTSVTALRQANPLTSDSLHSGQNLLIPESYHGSLPVMPRQAAASSALDANASDATYTVEAGDSLGKIAQKLHTSVTLLKTANHLNSDAIQVGQELIAPHSTSQTQAPKTTSALSKPAKVPTSTAPTLASAATINATYVVQPGDSIDKIAKRFNVKADAILQWNNLAKGGLVHPNDQLILHPSSIT